MQFVKIGQAFEKFFPRIGAVGFGRCPILPIGRRTCVEMQGNTVGFTTSRRNIMS